VLGRYSCDNERRRGLLRVDSLDHLDHRARPAAARVLLARPLV